MKIQPKVRGAWLLSPAAFAMLGLLSVLLSPTAFAQVPTLLGDLDADGKPTVVDLQRLLNHLGTNAQTRLSPALLPYADINEDGAVNTNDLRLLQNAILGRSSLPNPYAAPVVTVPTFATNGSVITITGTARPNRRILITGGRFAVFATADSNGLFTAQVSLRGNQVNALFVMATNSTFTAGIPQPLRILQDSQPPNLFVDFPTNGATLYTDSTVIAGRVGDSLSGFAGLNVTIRAVASQVDYPAVVDVGIGSNGTYERGNVPLAPGTNEFMVTATDIHGNSSNRVFRIIRAELAGPRLLAVSGDAQKTNVHRRLSQPIVVKSVQADGVTPLANTLVTFEVTRSDGRLLPGDATALVDPNAFTNDINRTVHGVPRVTLRTDATGIARALWAMGGDAGCGNNRVCVTGAGGISNNVYFCASADPALPKQINIGTGNNQKAETGGFLPEPLRAWVNDSCNGNAGMPVTFTVIQGGGRLHRAPTTETDAPIGSPLPGGEGQGEGGSRITVATTRTGHAEVLFQLGPDAGQNIVEASYPGNPFLPATFIAYGVARDPSKSTTLTGLLLDNTSCPIGGATCSVSVGGSNFVTTTDVQGRFYFGQPGTTNSEPETLPSGPAQLRVNGSTATNLLGATIPTNSFPSLEFQLVLIPNAENSLPSPVLLPRLNLANQRLYYGTNDLVLTCEGMEGLKMTIKAGSMRDPSGRPVTPSNPVQVSLNQVHHDNVPMPIPDGASPPFAWTLQPGGSTFDPPIQIEYPNMSGLPAGTIAYFLSFNHDTRRFEIICSGHVREDSSTIVSDPDAGLTIAGWGCNCPPYSVSGKTLNCCKVAVGIFQGGLSTASDTSKARWAEVFQKRLVGEFQTRIWAPIFTAGAQLSNFRSYIQRIVDSSPSEFCSKPRIVMFGYSAGGGTVHYSGSFPYPVAYRMTVDPIDAPSVAGYCYGVLSARNYQRDCNLDSPIDLNYLAADLTGADRTRCDTISSSTDGFCSRGFHVNPGVNIVLPGTDHFSAIGSVGGFWVARETLVEAVRSVLADEPAQSPILMAAALDRNALGLGDIDAENEAGGNPPDLFMVNGQSVVTDGDGRVAISNISAPDQFGPGGPGTLADFVSDDYVRVIGTSTKGGTNRYAFSEFFQIRQGQTTFINDLTFTDTPPRKPESLTILPESRLMTGVFGETNRLRVIARYADGSTNNVPAKTAWTTYRVSNPGVATVTPDGEVISKARGVVYVTAVNEGASATVLIAVSPNDTLTTVVGVVRDTNGVPVAGATVTVGALGKSVVTDAEGRFTIEGVPTGLGQLTVAAVVLRGTNLPLVAISGLVTPVAGGLTDAGEIVALPGFPGLAYIPPGTFVMGSPTSERLRWGDEIQHAVTLSNGFWMGRYEVTQGEWLEVMGNNPSYFTNGRAGFPPGPGSATTNAFRHPVETVSWIDATNYCAQLTARERLAGRIPFGYFYRLPTEAEWEYACRGGTTNAFHYGKALRAGMANFITYAEYDADVGDLGGPTTRYLGRTSPVGSFAANAYGLYDMHGSVWEWCADWYGGYSSESVTNPVGPSSGDIRVYRGGGWNDYGWNCRSADRDGYYPEYRDRTRGLRVVLAPSR